MRAAGATDWDVTITDRALVAFWGRLLASLNTPSLPPSAVTSGGRAQASPRGEARRSGRQPGPSKSRSTRGRAADPPPGRGDLDARSPRPASALPPMKKSRPVERPYRPGGRTRTSVPTISLEVAGAAVGSRCPLAPFAAHEPVSRFVRPLPTRGIPCACAIDTPASGRSSCS
jgi:hypothetical protein